VNEYSKENDEIGEILKKLGVTAEDIRRFINIISMWFYHKVNKEDLSPMEVIAEIAPNPADILNLTAFLAAWKDFNDKAMKAVSQTVSQFSATTITPEMLKHPEMALAQMILQQRLGNQQPEIAPDELMELNSKTDEERLKKSLAKVKEGAKEDKAQSKEKEGSGND
jgi:hypothetical protein